MKEKGSERLFSMLLDFTEPGRTRTPAVVNDAF